MAEKKRHIPLWWIAGIVLLLVTVGGVLYFLFRPLNGPVPEGAKTRYVNLPQGTTDQGFPRLGNVDAPILVEEFSSFACPHCQSFHEDHFPTLLDQIAAGQVQYVYIPISTIGSGSKEAAEASLCAAEQGQFWEMHDTLFYWMDKYSFSTFADRRIRSGAENLDLNLDQFEICQNEHHVSAVLDEAMSEFRRRDLSGTPTLFINGERVRDYAELDNLSIESTETP